MANPPQTIGPFTNVPAPGSPIRSDWPVQVTQYLGYKALFSSRTSTLAVTAGTWTNIVSLTSTGFRAGRYIIFGDVFGASTANVGGSIRILTGTGNESQWPSLWSPSDSVIRLVSRVMWLYQLPADGTITANLQINPSVAGLTVQVATCAMLAYVGY